MASLSNRSTRILYAVFNGIIILSMSYFTAHRYEVISYLYSGDNFSLYKILKYLEYDLVILTFGSLSLYGALFRYRSFVFYVFSSFFQSIILVLILRISHVELMNAVIIIAEIGSIFLLLFSSVFDLQRLTRIKKGLILIIGAIIYWGIRFY